ncbi:hypothetical protein C1886_10775 [Pseudomonas sp. FW300-N1A1]|uniref:DUF6386 family protein n=1 Tax=Pseudomonas sp. FW300-N1A1 TaxID=2075555 RepID=UPI000CD25046|nr:DUF6386 family protein [Pseudomonas sp. FW300-N1A1]POA19971.1 hypothetical protein C1886_10775 [Pseudomonas sp. FW300-N1A1]
MAQDFSIYTDTATVAVFDLAAIRHRISDTPDWWSVVKDEVQEVNEGNVAFLGVGQDGSYKVVIVDDIVEGFGVLRLGFPSGQVFIGAGEDTTGGDLEPDGSDSIQGVVVEFESGNYMMKYKKTGNVLELAFESAVEKFNNFMDSIRL